MLKKISDSIFNKIDSLIFTYKIKGASGVIRALLRKLGTQIYAEKLLFFYLNLQSMPDEPKLGNEFRKLKGEEITDNLIFNDGFHTKNQVEHRLNHGHLLFVHERSAKLVYFVWIEQKDIMIDYFTFDLPSDVVYLANEFTIPEFRGLGIAKHIRKQIFQYLKNQGIKYIILVVNPKNKAALKLNKSCGFTEYQTLFYRSFMYFRYYKVRSARINAEKTYIKLYKPSKDIWKLFADFL